MGSSNTLDEAIMALVKKGIFDAPTLVQRLTKRDDWPAIVTQMAEELATTRAQDLIRAYRRDMEREAAKKSAVTVTESSGRTRQMKTGKIKASDIAKAPVFISKEIGFKAYADCTAADFRTRAAMYEKIAGKATSRAAWCYSVADVMEAQNAATFKALGTHEIPALPDDDTLDEVMEGAAA